MTNIDWKIYQEALDLVTFRKWNPHPLSSFQSSFLPVTEKSVWEQLWLRHDDIKRISGVVLQFWVKKQWNKALLLKNKALFSKNKALSRIKICVNFIFIFQNLLLNHFYCMLLSSWVLVFPLTICFYNLKINYFKVFLPKNSRARTWIRKVTYSSPILVL